MTTDLDSILRAIEASKPTVSLEGAFDDDGDEMPGIFPAVEDTFDRYGWEQLIHSLPQEQLELFVCLYLGFKPTEIVEILHYPNIVRYYNVSSKMRKIFKERKEVCLDYN